MKTFIIALFILAILFFIFTCVYFGVLSENYNHDKSNALARAISITSFCGAVIMFSCLLFMLIMGE